MNFKSAEDLSLHLISCAFRRCRVSEHLCRLSVVLKLSSASDPPIVRISISDTGIGSCLEEFRGIKVSMEAFSAQDWDGLLLVTTTCVSDIEISNYLVNLKECGSGTVLTRLPSKPKNGVKFSGTEVCLLIAKNPDVLIEDIKRFFRKILILKMPNVVFELAVEHEDTPGSRNEQLFLANECNPLPFSASHFERFNSGIEDFVLRHGNTIKEQCKSCFPNPECLKSGSGMAFPKENSRSKGLVVEAVILISEIAEQKSTCLRAFDTKTEVMYFRDFLASPISQSSIKALTGVDWKSYGLTLKSVEYRGENVLIEWENLPSHAHIDIALHLYNDQVTIPSTRLKTLNDHNLTKKALKLALDDLRNKHAGVLLSAHALKIQSYAPDLAKTIVGLIMSSNDSHFQRECFSLLGFRSRDVGDEAVEACIKEKINYVIEMNDKNPRKSKDISPFLFDDQCIMEQAEMEYDEYEGDYAFSPMDI